MKKSLFLSLLLLVSLGLQAAQRSQQEAMTIARQFLQKTATTRAVNDVVMVASSVDLPLGTAMTRSAGMPAFYIFNAEDSYAIVSADDRMIDVIGYSDKGQFVVNNLPSNILWWLQFYQKEYDALGVDTSTSVQTSRLIGRVPTAKSANSNADTIAMDGKVLSSSSATTRAVASAINPLLGDIAWNQDEPYNNKCPKSGSERTLTGCVATALAQVMKYFSYPTTSGQGSISYTTDTKKLSCKFDYAATTFDWNNMLNSYKDSYTDEQATAVATLMYACGCLVSMDYNTESNGGSAASAVDIPDNMATYLGYSKNAGNVNRDYFTYSEWTDMIKKELNAKRPIVYSGQSRTLTGESGGGHCFVIDGYSADDLYHVNWGWGGSNNGYFALTTLSPTSKGLGGGSAKAGGFAYDQGMAIGLAPSTENIDYQSFFSCDSLVFNNNTTYNNVVLTKGSTFNMTAKSLYNLSSSFSGSLALIAEKNGTQTVLFEQKEISLDTYYGYSNAKWTDVTMPSTLGNGTYTLYLASKDGRESKWQRVRCMADEPGLFTMVVNGTTCRVTPYYSIEPDKSLSATLAIDYDVTCGGSFSFTEKWTNTNTNTEYLGNIGFLITSADEKTNYTYYAAQQMVNASAKDQVINFTSKSLKTNLAPTADSIKYTSSTKLPAGTYRIYPTYEWLGYVYSSNAQGTALTVGEELPAVKLTASNLSTSPRFLDMGADLTIKVNLAVEGGGTYAGQIALAFFPAGAKSTTDIVLKDVYVKGSSSEQWVFNPGLTTGNYTLAIYQYDEDSDDPYTQLKPTASIYVTSDTYTGIEDEIETPSKLVVYSQPVEDVLRFATPAKVASAEIYDVNGKAIMTKTIESQYNSTYSINVSGLASGYYLLRVKTTDGKLQGGKFLKK